MTIQMPVDDKVLTADTQITAPPLYQRVHIAVADAGQVGPASATAMSTRWYREGVVVCVSAVSTLSSTGIWIVMGSSLIWPPSLGVAGGTRLL